MSAPWMVKPMVSRSRAFTRSRRKFFGSIGKIGKTLVNFPDRVGQVIMASNTNLCSPMIGFLALLFETPRNLSLMCCKLCRRSKPPVDGDGLKWFNWLYVQGHYPRTQRGAIHRLHFAQIVPSTALLHPQNTHCMYAFLGVAKRAELQDRN